MMIRNSQDNKRVQKNALHHLHYLYCWSTKKVEKIRNMKRNTKEIHLITVEGQLLIP